MKRIALVAVIIGCAGKAPPEPANGGVDAPTGGDTDAGGSDSTSLEVSGTVVDYFTGNLLGTTLVQTDGIDPAISATSADDGSYNLQLATGSKLYLLGSRANYMSTRNAATTIAAMPVMQHLFVLSESDVQRQYSSVGTADRRRRLPRGAAREERRHAAHRHRADGGPAARRTKVRRSSFDPTSRARSATSTRRS